MPTKKHDEISEHLQRIKSTTDHGYYAPVIEISLSLNGDEDTLDITVQYPNENVETFSLSVPEYWEEDRVLPSILSTLNVSVGSVGELEDRSIPISRVDGSWEVDMDRLNNGDYLVGNSHIKDE